MSEMTVDWNLVTDDDCRHALRRNHATLVESLDCTPMVLGLFSKSVITQLIKEQIEAERTRASACNILLDIVRRRGKQAFQVFVEQLIVTEQPHLYDLVVNELRQRAPKAFISGATPRQVYYADGRQPPTAADNQSPPVNKSPSSAVQVDANARRSASGGPTATPAALVQPSSRQQQQQQQQLGDEVYVAVQLFMSVRHTHIEVQAVCHSNLRLLERWLQAWRDQEPDQPDMPAPHRIMTNFAVGRPLAAHLTSSIAGSKPYHHSCEEIIPRPLLLDDGPATVAVEAVGKPAAWLFQLVDPQHMDHRVFSLYLHELTSDGALGAEICSKFEVRDYVGKCFMPQLGFTLYNNQPPETDGISGSNFARSTTSGGIHAAQAIRAIAEQSSSVGAVFIHRMDMIGTGFCVGTPARKYFMTCYHVIDGRGVREALQAENLLVSFADSIVGDGGKVCHITRCIAENKDLDYAILEVKEQDKMPQPIKCCPGQFEQMSNDGLAVKYLTIVGYSVHARTIDVAVDLLIPTAKLISIMKTAISDGYPQLRAYLNDYDNLSEYRQNALFYNVARHKQGSSGSPVFYCTATNRLCLVALHSRGIPKFYYSEHLAHVAKLLPTKYTVEVGVRMSCIHSDLAANPELQAAIFTD